MKDQRILLLDNYDSFTYNLVHYVEELTGNVCKVVRNDAFNLNDLHSCDGIIISPGPGLPEEAGQLITIVKTAISSGKKMLGVCLGMQAMVMASGGSLKQLKSVMHGLQRNCMVTDDGDALLAGVPKTFSAGRYHSWVVDPLTLPDEFIVTSVDESNNIMSMRHRVHQAYGMQFHPESIMTPAGKQMIKNWIAIYK